MPMSTPQYRLEKVWKICEAPTETVTILEGVDLTVEAGDELAVVGASGSGKSTLLHLLGALDEPTRGVLTFEGHDLAAMNDLANAQFRNRRLGFVFRFHHMLPDFSTFENVALQALMSGMSLTPAFVKA